VTLTPILKSSEYLDPDIGDMHNSSWWQITSNPGNYDTPIFDSGPDTVNLLTISVDAGLLDEGIRYHWRVRHQDGNGEWSDWSTESQFTTQMLPNTPPDKPTNTGPTDGSSVSPASRLISSTFSDPDQGDNHSASQWQITLTPGNYTDPIFDSGPDTTHLLSLAIPIVATESSTYFWRIRHRDDRGAWSEWSDETVYKVEGSEQLMDLLPIVIIMIGGIILVIVLVIYRRRRGD
jgi:hypothetical protein